MSVMQIDVLELDITRFEGDVIVNAANAALAGGGGVDGAIHRAAGPELSAACAAIPWVARHVRCPPGEIRVTPGFGLQARWLFHAVGPIYGQTPDAPAVLAACYRACLSEAVERGAATIAFPAISCGVYGYPVAAAAKIAVGVCREQPWALERAVFALVDPAALRAWRSVVADP